MFLCILIIYIYILFYNKIILNKALKPLFPCCCYFPPGSVPCPIGCYRLEPTALRAARTQVWSRDLTGRRMSHRLCSGLGPERNLPALRTSCTVLGSVAALTHGSPHSQQQGGRRGENGAGCPARGRLGRRVGEEIQACNTALKTKLQIF